MKRNMILIFLFFAICVLNAQNDSESTSNRSERSFSAIGPNKPVVEYISNPISPVPDELEKVAVEVYFDLLPTMMRFSLPCYPSMVTENDIHFSNGWTETYDPKASSSCEILWDREAKYSRMWIESQNPARIVVRVRAALCDPDGYIAHSYIPSGSPYGKGDWTDEWYYIYPDGVHIRHVRIYSGLAGQSLTVTDETFGDTSPIREIPPSVVHEFQEDFVFGLPKHLPKDDIDVSAITFIHLDGTSKTFSYRPYPNGFGDFTLAPIKIVNLKSEYKPFTISIPHGLENETYPPEGELPHIFQTWLKGEEGGYSASLGHSLNWWHYRRTENILEQVYLSGMTNAQAPEEELVDLAKSWLDYPRLLMDGVELSYTETFFDPAQRAYVIPWKYEKNNEMKFKLGFPGSEDEAAIPISLVNPALVIKNFGKKDFELKINDKILSDKIDYKMGYEETEQGIDLVIWMKMKSKESISIILSRKE